MHPGNDGRILNIRKFFYKFVCNYNNWASWVFPTGLGKTADPHLTPGSGAGSAFNLLLPSAQKSTSSRRFF